MATSKKTALITGASGGIGLELARVFGRNGCDLVLVARSTDKLQQLSAELKAQYQISSTLITADLCIAADIERVFTTVQESGLNVDYLVNNAGFGDHHAFASADWPKLQRMIELNIGALTRLTYLFLPKMIERGAGRIMNVASTAAFQPGPGMAVYYATKAYVLSFSEAIAFELESQGVSVTALCPGPTESGFQSVAEMGEIPLIKSFKLPKSAEVAEYGYDAMMRGKVVAVHGISNRAAATLARLAPRSLVVKVVNSIQNSGGNKKPALSKRPEL